MAKTTAKRSSLATTVRRFARRAYRACRRAGGTVAEATSAYQLTWKRTWRGHAAHREEANAARRAYYAAHREEANAASRAWRAVHREEHNALCQAWREAHRTEQRIYNGHISARDEAQAAFRLALFQLLPRGQARHQFALDTLYDMNTSGFGKYSTDLDSKLADVLGI